MNGRCERIADMQAAADHTGVQALSDCISEEEDVYPHLRLDASGDN